MGRDEAAPDSEAIGLRRVTPGNSDVPASWIFGTSRGRPASGFTAMGKAYRWGERGMSKQR